MGTRVIVAMTALAAVAILAPPAGADALDGAATAPFGVDPQLSAPGGLNQHFVPAQLDLIGEAVKTCNESSLFGQACRETGVAGTAAGQCCPFAQAQADQELVFDPVTGSFTAAPRETARVPTCYQGACPAEPGMLATWIPPGGCTFCTNDHSYGTTSSVRTGVLGSGGSLVVSFVIDF